MTRRLRRQLVDRLPEPTLRRIQRIRHRENPALRRAVPRPSGRGITPQVVRTFDAHAVRAEVAAAVAAALDRGRVPYVLLPGPRGSTRQVAVSAEDRPAALAALASALAGPGWALTPNGGRRQRAPVLKAYRVLSAPGGAVLSGADTACEVAFWRKITRLDALRLDGDPHLEGTRVAPGNNGVVAYLSEPAWTRATASATHWALEHPRPDVFEVHEPIDFVYTWVDGADPQWLAKKADYSPGTGLNPSALHASRFLNRDELRYALRSVGMYASWVRKIHIVTDGQVPDWLDASHPQIAVVDHRDIFRDPDALPVFNSHAIESQLHHIDGLAEHYLYLNDDVFFGRPVFPELFFHGNGIAKFFLARDPLDLDPPSPRDLPVDTAAKNQRTLIEQEFGATVRRKFRHAPHPQLRSVVDQMERRHPELFERVSHSRFRHPDDLSIPSSLQHYYSYALGRAVPAECGYMYQDIGQANTPRRLDEILRKRPQTFCLNDMGTELLDPGVQQEALEQFFGEYFPLPSRYETRQDSES